MVVVVGVVLGIAITSSTASTISVVTLSEYLELLVLELRFDWLQECIFTHVVLS